MDYNLKTAARHGICAALEPGGGGARYQPASFILDPALRVPVTRGRRYCVHLDDLVEDKRRDEVEMAGATASAADPQVR
ncbi:MAG: hypothetical protein AB7S71_08645 [Dongiaceae bacterium]